jgi:hypothetical protein
LKPSRFISRAAPRIAKVGSDHRHPFGAGILQRADEKNEPAKLVIGALRRPAVKAVNYMNIGAPHRIQRTNLMLPILKLPFFVAIERAPQALCNSAAEIVAALKREKPQRPGVPGLPRCVGGRPKHGFARLRPCRSGRCDVFRVHFRPSLSIGCGSQFLTSLGEADRHSSDKACRDLA